MPKFLVFNNKEYTKEEVILCANDAYRNKSSKEEYTAEDRQDAINTIVGELSKDYRNNKHKLFAILEGVIDEVLPEKVAEFVQFAEVKNFKWGETIRFRVKSKNVKAYSVALGGTVRRSRMDSDWVTIEVSNIQAKVYEEVMNIKAGHVDFKELVDACIEAITDEVNARIYQAVLSTYDVLPTANKHKGAGIDEAKMVQFLQISKSYGTPVIYGTARGLAELPINMDLATEQDKLDLRDKGFVGIYKGAKVFEIKNPVADQTNASFKYSDAYLFVIPAGKEKLVKVAFEGESIIREREHDDWTVDFEVAKRTGVAVLEQNHVCIYHNEKFSI